MFKSDLRPNLLSTGIQFEHFVPAVIRDKRAPIFEPHSLQWKVKFCRLTCTGNPLGPLSDRLFTLSGIGIRDEIVLLAGELSQRLHGSDPNLKLV